MAEYRSRFAGLSFYVNGVRKKFRDGVYRTEDPKEIEVLDKLSDVVRVDEPQESKEPEKQAEDSDKSAEKKAPATRKSSAK